MFCASLTSAHETQYPQQIMIYLHKCIFFMFQFFLMFYLCTLVNKNILFIFGKCIMFFLLSFCQCWNPVEVVSSAIPNRKRHSFMSSLPIACACSELAKFSYFFLKLSLYFCYMPHLHPSLQCLILCVCTFLLVRLKCRKSESLCRSTVKRAFVRVCVSSEHTPKYSIEWDEAAFAF